MRVAVPRAPNSAALWPAVLAGSGAWANEHSAATIDGPSAQATKTRTATDDAAELAKKLNNPIASLISVPLKYSWDTGIDPGDRDLSTYIVLDHLH